MISTRFATTACGVFKSTQGPRPLRNGDTVLVHDGGEEEALGTVHAIDSNRDLIFVDVDWDTFGERGRFRYLPNGAWVATTAKMVVGELGHAKLLHVVHASDKELIRDKDEHSVGLTA